MPSQPVSPTAQRVTLREVAQHLGVSVATVSNAYNRPDQLSKAMRERVLAAAAALGYRGPDPLARSLRRGKTGVIGVVYDAPLEYAFADPAASLFLGSVAHTIQHEGLNVLLLASPADLFPDAQPVRTASIDGLIVYCAAEGSDLLRAVLERQLPTVLVDQDSGIQGNHEAMQVGIDDAGGARQAAEHLVSQGHREIGVLCLQFGPEERGGIPTEEALAHIAYRTTAERWRGYQAGISHAGISAEVQLWPIVAAQNLPGEGERRAAELLHAHPEITALLCMSDVLAQGALRAAAALGRRVPDDLSIVGYDDLPLSAALNLTTIWQPTAEKGQWAGEALLGLLRGERVEPERGPLPTRLVVRGSTGKKVERVKGRNPR